MNIPKRNPKMYQLVAMESESSFWWDSVDSTVNLNDDGGDQKFAETDDGMLRAVRYYNVVQVPSYCGSQGCRITVEIAYMAHGCKVSPRVWSIFGWSQSYN